MSNLPGRRQDETMTDEAKEPELTPDMVTDMIVAVTDTAEIPIAVSAIRYATSAVITVRVLHTDK